MAKKGRHRRYIEAREFQRSSTFSVENFDLDAPDPFALPETRADDDYEEDIDEDTDSGAYDDKYAELAAKYADFGDPGTSSNGGSESTSADGPPSSDDAGSADLPADPQSA